MAVKDKKSASTTVTKEKKIPKDYIMNQKAVRIPSKILAFAELQSLIHDAVNSHKSIPAYARKTEWYCNAEDKTIITNVPVGIWKQHMELDVVKTHVSVKGSEYTITNWE